MSDVQNYARLGGGEWVISQMLTPVDTAQLGGIIRTKTATVARSDTTAKTLFTLPGNAVIVGVRIYAAAASNAGTTATLSVGFQGGTGVEVINAQDVKTASSGQGLVTPNKGVLGSVGVSAVTVTGIYAETGAASSAGGPWTVVIDWLL